MHTAVHAHDIEHTSQLYSQTECNTEFYILNLYFFHIKFGYILFRFDNLALDVLFYIYYGYSGHN